MLDSIGGAGGTVAGPRAGGGAERPDAALDGGCRVRNWRRGAKPGEWTASLEGCAAAHAPFEPTMRYVADRRSLEWKLGQLEALRRLRLSP